MLVPEIRFTKRVLRLSFEGCLQALDMARMTE